MDILIQFKYELIFTDLETLKNIKVYGNIWLVFKTVIMQFVRTYCVQDLDSRLVKVKVYVRFYLR